MITQPNALPIGRIAKANSDHILRPLYPASRLRYSASDDAHRTRTQAAAELQAARTTAAAELGSAQDRARQIEATAREQVRLSAGEQTAELVVNARAALAKWRAEAAFDLTATAVALARAILKVELAVRPEHISTIAAHALAHARLSREAAIQMHPEDAKSVEESLAGIKSAARFEGDLTLITDARLPRATVRIHTQRGVYDGSVATRIDELAKLLQEQLTQQPTRAEKETEP